ncbi:MAG: TIGR00730 family Rossman fold protein [Verrucomicrobiales bacterium]|nr:TIGR00730 family Rossman fold protein [Verrucomicrobiales bacterium]
MSSQLRSICVFCGAHSGTNPAFEQAARAVGKYFAENGIRLITGGGSFGLMGAVADGCLDAGGEMVGVITTYLEKRELAHPKATRMDVVETMLERKTRMAELSDAFVSLPGGIGTLDELFEMLTWSRLQEHDKPSGLLNVDGFYDELISFCCKTQVEAGFITAEDAANLIHSDNLPDLLEKLAEAAQDGPSSLYRD